MEASYHSGFVCLAGRPNVGKSTLLNRMVGKAISITTPKPQTTRNRILGVRHGEHWQAVFVDTPGIHHTDVPLNQRMVGYAVQALAEADLNLLMVEPGLPPTPEDALALERVREASPPALLVVNKVDRASRAQVLESLAHYGAAGGFEEIVPVSALTGDGVERLVELIVARLPEGPPFYEPGQITDQPESAVIAELVRQAVFMRAHQEVPYHTAVRVEHIEDKGKVLVVDARVIVERDSQKGIIIGKGGSMLKAIGSAARKRIEALLGVQVYLNLHVSVVKDWSRIPRHLDDLGYKER